MTPIICTYFHFCCIFISISCFNCTFLSSDITYCMRTSLIPSFYLCYIFISIPTFTLVTHSQLSASNFIFVTHSIQFLYLTRFHAPYHISAICSRSTYPRRLQLYSKFKFCNYLTPKIGLVSEKFSYGPWEALKVGRVANFCLKIDYSFTFTERRWSFLVEIEI